MSPASTPSTSALPTSSSAPSAARKFAWDWADDDYDDGWLDDVPNDIDFSLPLSSITPILLGSASNSLALTFSKPKASSPLSQPPTTAPIKPRPPTTSLAEALQHNIQSEAPRLQLTDSPFNTHRSNPPSKPAWRTLPKPLTADLRAGRLPLIDLSDDVPLPLNGAPSADINELDVQEQSPPTASPTDSPPKASLLPLKRRSGSSKIRVRRDKPTLDKPLSAEAIKLAEKKKSQLCLAYVSGSCPRGENCVYMHYDVVVAPVDAVETYEDLGLAKISEPNLIEAHSTVLFTNEDVSKVPFHNPFSPPQLDTSNSLIFSALPPPTELQSLFINHPTETNLPSLQPDGWWDKAEHAAPAPPPKSRRDSLVIHQFSPRLNALNDSNLSTPSTGSSSKRQCPPRLHLMESNLGSKWHTHPRGAPTALASYSFPAASDTFVAPVADVLYAPTDRIGVDGNRREMLRGRRWSIDGSMHGYKPGPCKYYQVSEPCPFGDRCPFEHSIPQYRAPPPTSEVEIFNPSFESEQALPVESPPSTPLPPVPSLETVSSAPVTMPESTSNPTGLTIYPTARVLSGGIRFGDMVSLTSKKGRRAVRAQTDAPKGIKVRDVNAGVIMVDAEMEVAIEKERQRAIAQQSQEPPRSKANTPRRGSQPNLVPKRRGSRVSATPTRRSSVASSSVLSTASESDVVCGMYKATGQCRFGSSCEFRHDIEPLNIPGARGSFEVFGTKKPVPGSQPGTSTAGSRRRGSMPLTPLSSSSLSLAEPLLQTPSSTSLPHHLGQLLPQGSPTGMLPRMKKSQALHFPTLTPSRRTSSIASDSTGPDFPPNFSTQQSRQPSLDRIDIVAYPDAEQAASMDGEQEDMVNAAILQSIMRVPTPALRPRDKPEHKTLSSLILAESSEPSTII